MLFWTLIYFPLLAASVCLMVVQVYGKMTLQRGWREWLTHHLLDRWLKNGRYYQLNLVTGDHKNPEYRIADDVRLATDSPVDFVSGVTAAVLSAATFITVLWTIGGSLSFRMAGAEITVPGFLVVAAVLYAVLASGSMVFIGRRFVAASENKNQAEAEFRYVLTRLSENGESIAVLGGEEEEASRSTIRSPSCSPGGARSASSGCAPPLFRRRAAISRRSCLSSCARRNSSTVDDARRGHAGGFGIHDRTERVQLAGRQLSAARRLDRVGPKGLSLMVSLDALERAETGDEVAGSSAPKPTAPPCASPISP